MRIEAKIGWIVLGFLITLGVQATPDEPVLGRPAGWVLEEPETTLVRLQAGSELRAEPSTESSLLQVLPEIQLALLEWRGSWARVTYGQQTGWVDIDQIPSSTALPMPEQTRQMALRVDPESLRLAQKYLGPEASVERIGSWTLHTDVDRPRLLKQLNSLAIQLEEQFAQRFGLLPVEADDRGVVILYRRQEAYRAFSREQGHDWEGGRSSAHAVPGLAILHAELRDEADLHATVVHELTHLLTWQTFGRLLPWWLEEGLAEDLALSRWVEGRLEPTPIRRVNLRYGETLGVVIAELNRVLKNQELLTMRDLLTLSSPEVASPDELSLLYTQVGLWVRFLLDDSHAERAEGFRSFLVSVAAGEEPDKATFLKHLDRPIEDLMADFAPWLKMNERAFATPHLILRRKRPAGLWLEDPESEERREQE